MITRNTRSTTIVLAALSLVLAAGAAEVQTPILYSGDISPTFGAVNDTCAFEITLWDATADGTRIGPMIERELTVHGGRYETELDFGPEAASDRSRYLQVAVGCPAGTAGLTTLTRRLFLPASRPTDHRRSGGRAVPHGTGAPPKAALGTAFTYQGELQESGVPVSGSGDFQFSLWDAASGGTQIGATVPVNGIAVSDGRFTASLDFGAAAFDGDARWLEIAVDYPSGTGSPSTLSPRQPLSAAPYALQTRGIFVDDAGNVGIGTDTPTRPFHLIGSSTFDGDVHIDTGHDLQFPDTSNRIYTDLGDLRLESDNDLALVPSGDLKVDGDTLVVDSSLNRVGVGTATPREEIEVVGNGRITGALIASEVHATRFEVFDSIDFYYQGNWIGLGPSNPRVVFQGTSLQIRGADDVEIIGANLGVGTLAPEEMLHVKNSDASGHAFLKVQTSHFSDWGETGIRFETPQNRWHLRMDDDANNNLPEGALGLRCNTPGHEIMTWTENGMVGVGNTNPSAKLDVVGDLELSGAYRGSIGPNNGAPFPRPAYDSGWVAIDQGWSADFPHGIGGDVDDYVVDLQLRGTTLETHNLFIGGDGNGTSFKGVYWWGLNSTVIWVTRHTYDIDAEEVRVRIWVVN